MSTVQDIGHVFYLLQIRDLQGHFFPALFFKGLRSLPFIIYPIGLVIPNVWFDVGNQILVGG